MRSLRAMSFFSALALAAVVAGSSAADKTKPAGAEACFSKLKTLAGDWMTKDPQTGKEVLALRYKVTAAGSALEETIFAGEPHEMVTLYHLDNGSLVLTHYCALGNQPHLKATEASTPSKMEFTCIGGGNMKSESDMHMHHADVTIKDADHVVTHWAAYKDGKPAGHEVSFEVHRKSVK